MTREEALEAINNILLDDDKETVTEDNQLKDVIVESLDYAVFFLDMQDTFGEINEAKLVEHHIHLGNVYVHQLIDEILGEEPCL